jgi:hypothetical protein
MRKSPPRANCSVDIEMTTEQILVTTITHSETIGMSVLPENAGDDEFRQIIVEKTTAQGPLLTMALRD